MVEKEIINDAIEMTKNIPGSDVLTPLTPEDKELVPYPKVEYKIIESPTMDKLVRDVNVHLANGRVCDGWVQVSNGPITRFYQSLERWVVPWEEEMTPREKNEEINYWILEEVYSASGDLPTNSEENADWEGGGEIY